MFDVLKQFQNEVNDIRSERLARSANPLALLAAAQPKSQITTIRHQNLKDRMHQLQAISSTHQTSTDTNKGKEIAKPVTPQSESVSEEDSDPEQARRDKDMQKNLALLAKYFKKLYKPTNNNLRTSSNSTNKTEDTTPRYNNDNQSSSWKSEDSAVAREPRETDSQSRSQSGLKTTRITRKDKMCKQAEQGVPLQAEQAEWQKRRMRIDEQELEAHYSYMAKIQEVDQNAAECVDERAALANLTLDTEENKTVLKQLKKANASLTQELKECKTNLDETSRALGEATSSRDSSLIALQTKQTELEKYTALNDLTSDYKILQTKLNETLGLLALKDIDIKEGQLKEKSKVISDLKVKEGKDIDTMIEMDKQIKFLNEILYKRNQSIQTIHMLAPKCATVSWKYPICDTSNDPRKEQISPDGEEIATLAKERK
ncbi:hypothetical protein Tco_0783019 [Tanacetum coccineum]